MTHGHELKGGNAGGRGCAGLRQIKGGKLYNCNSIINKIYLIKKDEHTLNLQVNKIVHCKDRQFKQNNSHKPAVVNVFGLRTLLYP